MTRFALFFITLYQWLASPFFSGSCRFVPSCSAYAHEAITRHGATRGGWMALKRLLRCRPFTKPGFDPVME